MMLATYLGVSLAAGAVVMSLWCIVTRAKIKTSLWALSIGILFFAAFVAVWMGVAWRIS